MDEGKENSPVKAFPDKDNNSKSIDEIVRSRKESESFDMKYLAFVLVDLIPYERKEEMILSFENLFSLPTTGTRIYDVREQIRDITEGGSSGFHARLGHIHNVNKLKPDRNQAISSNDMRIYDDWGVKAELPSEVDRIEIWVGQEIEIDFCYYVYYFCYVNKKYQKISRETYIHSGDTISFKTKWGDGTKPQGPKFDPTLQMYENKVGLFLSKYVNGLYINESFTMESAVPSLRILSTPIINFSDLTKWSEEYWLFLEYMRINRYFHKYYRSIISPQTDKIFQKSFLPKGITILYSEETQLNDKKDEDVFDKIISNASVTIDSLIAYFLPLYWTNYNIFNPLSNWKSRLKLMQYGIKSKSLTIEELEEKVTEINDLYGEFTIFSNEERVNIRIVKEIFHRIKNLKGPGHVNLYEIGLFKDFSNLIEERFKDEEILIDDIQKQIDSLTSYYRDKSNLKLSFSNISLQKSYQLVQKRVSRLTITIAAVGVVIGVISLLIDLF